MAVEVRIRGAEKLRRVADDLRQASRTDLIKELSKGLREAIKPFAQAVHRQAGTLPKRGGYAGVMDGALRVQQRTRTAAEQASARIVVSGKGRSQNRDVAALNQGILRHPVYGNRNHWVVQEVKPGLVDEPWKQLQDEVTRAAEAAVDRVADKLERG